MSDLVGTEIFGFLMHRLIYKSQVREINRKSFVVIFLFFSLLKTEKKENKKNTTKDFLFISLT